MLVRLGFSTKATFLSLGSKLFPFQRPGQQATPLSPPPPLRRDSSARPRDCPGGGSASANQRARVQKALKALPVAARLVQDGCGSSEREGSRLLCASNVCFYAGWDCAEELDRRGLWLEERVLLVPARLGGGWAQAVNCQRSTACVCVRGHGKQSWAETRPLPSGLLAEERRHI